MIDLIGVLLQRLNLILSHPLLVIGSSSVTIGTVVFLIGWSSLLWFLTAFFEKWLTAKLSKVDAFSDTLKRQLLVVTRWTVRVIGVLWILDLSNVDITAVQVVAYADSFLNIPFVHIGKTQITLWSVIYVLSLWLVLIVATNRLQKWCATKLLVHSGIEFGARHAISVIVKYVMVSIGFVVILQSAGIDLSALTVLAGAVGLGLSFGLQNITSNLVSGLIVLIERPIKVGDRIEVAGITGDVKNIALRATTICTNDNIEIIVPNSEFISGNVINWSHSSRDVRVSLPVGVSYSSDPEAVYGLLLDVASQHDGVLQDPPATVIFKAFGDSSLDFVLRVSTKTHVTSPAILQSELNFAIFKKFKQNGIEFPFPQRDLHVRSVVDLDGLLKSDKGQNKAADTSTV
ncbi:MAG: mechanosensitive ion channel [Candidatus Melainabacteria bacterium]|nr:mechanosensitive ion channel [Candidatus Melainabacteria bacterium]